MYNYIDCIYVYMFTYIIYMCYVIHTFVTFSWVEC